MPQVALAYIDPGSGSFLFQSLLAIVVGAGFAIKLSWQSIKRFMRQRILGRNGD